jgi:hypothetical protein
MEDHHATSNRWLLSLTLLPLHLLRLRLVSLVLVSLATYLATYPSLPLSPFRPLPPLPSLCSCGSARFWYLHTVDSIEPWLTLFLAGIYVSLLVGKGRKQWKYASARVRERTKVCDCVRPTAIKPLGPASSLPCCCAAQLVRNDNAHRHHNPQRPAPPLTSPPQRPSAPDAKLGHNGDDDTSNDMSLDALQSQSDSLSQDAPADGRGTLCGGCKLSVESDTGGIVVAFGYVPDLLTILTAC